MKNPFKLTVKDQIEKQIDDALFDLHQCRMSAQHYLNQIKYLEDKLELLQKEKDFYAKIYAPSGSPISGPHSGGFTPSQTQVAPDPK
jgi:hypothetical protein